MCINLIYQQTRMLIFKDRIMTVMLNAVVSKCWRIILETTAITGLSVAHALISK